MVLADFYGITSGRKGQIDQICRRSDKVQWHDVCDPVNSFAATTNGEHLVAHHIDTTSQIRLTAATSARTPLIVSLLQLLKLTAPKTCISALLCCAIEECA
jgi:hypothetical protein